MKGCERSLHRKVIDGRTRAGVLRSDWDVHLQMQTTHSQTFVNKTRAGWMCEDQGKFSEMEDSRLCLEADEKNS